MTRRALVVPAAGGLPVLAELPDVAVKAGDVVVRPRFVGVCGTDLELVTGAIDPAYVRYPLVLGHEWSGTVEQVGDDAAGVRAGDRVVAEGIIPCGACVRCGRGETNLCTTYDEVGFTRDGAASDQLVVPGGLVHVLKPRVDLLDAALLEPAAVVAQGLARLRLEPGMTVLVVGAGTIALLAAQLLRLFSPARICVLARRGAQESLAMSAGADAYAAGEGLDPRNAFSHPDGFDVVIEAAGSVQALATAIGAARRGGSILSLGLPPVGDILPLRADRFLNDDLSLVASFASTGRAWNHVVAALDAGAFAPGKLVTHRFPLSEHAAAFELLRTRREPVGKILLEI